MISPLRNTRSKDIQGAAAWAAATALGTVAGAQRTVARRCAAQLLHGGRPGGRSCRAPMVLTESRAVVGCCRCSFGGGFKRLAVEV